MAAIGPLVMLLALYFHLIYAVIEDPDCYPTDYVRVAGICNASGQRAVRFFKSRSCKDPFPVPVTPRIETCLCTPEDFIPMYQANSVTGTCELTYTPINCTGGSASAPLTVSPRYCDVENQACKESDIRSTYTNCDYVRDDITGAYIAGTRSVKVIYFFDTSCNPSAHGSVHLPPNSFIPCDLNCGAGQFLDGERCKTCSAGTYSLGGAQKYADFSYVDPYAFKTSCLYENATGQHTCNGWYARGGFLFVGPFDSSNNWFQDECAVDPLYDCHNNLRAELTMTVKLVRDGYVKFVYMVNSEKGFDGLSFYLDLSEKPEMPLQSFQFHPKTAKFNLTQGFHTLAWVYSKDEKWTKGHDVAIIMSIEIDGTDQFQEQCISCPPGMTSVTGARTCTQCPPDTFNALAGSPTCDPCPANSYALGGFQIDCFPRPLCNLTKHAHLNRSACNMDTNQYTKSLEWIQPKICLSEGGEVLPPAETLLCEPCPPGRIAQRKAGTNLRVCALCPRGYARGAEESECHKCPPGTAAVRELTLDHFEKKGGHMLPDDFSTGCAGDCGTNGWRVVGDALDSGSGHGRNVQLWLGLNVTLETPGEIIFNYSMLFVPGHATRAMVFYIDDEPSDQLQEEDVSVESTRDYTLSGPFPLSRGHHTLVWEYKKSNAFVDTVDDPGTDVLTIHSIVVRGESRGGAPVCEEVPEGGQGLTDGTGWIDCPPGLYSNGGNSTCTKCPANTYGTNEMSAFWGCVPCGPGTSSLPGSTECVWGDISIPSSFCTYAPPLPEGENVTDLTFYDFSALSLLHPDSMFGPVYDVVDSTAASRENVAKYFVSMCDKAYEKRECINFKGIPIRSYICMISGKNLANPHQRTAAYSLGDRLSILPLSSDAKSPLNRRGVILNFFGERCPYTFMERETNITLVCDPGAGYGQPEEWTEEGKKLLFDESAPFPWTNRLGNKVKIEDNETCQFNMVWYSAYACPLCRMENFEAVHIQSCMDNKYITYKFKEPKMCQSNPQIPLPVDIMCQPCTEKDYKAEEGNCADENRQHNITYRWIQPKICSEFMNESAFLPVNIIVGACQQRILVVTRSMSPAIAFLVAFGGVLIVFLSVLSLVTYIKSRRIYTAYSKLVGDGEEMGDVLGTGEEGQGDVEEEETDRKSGAGTSAAMGGRSGNREEKGQERAKNDEDGRGDENNEHAPLTASNSH